jgi:pyruvate dehydrogenase E2 component (dihydrolipoamide acetyltransferase)
MFRSTVDQPTSAPSPPVSAPSLKGETTVVEPDRAARSLARRTAEIRATVPDLELSVDVDAGELTTFAQHRACSTTAVLVGACARALREFPQANAAYRDGRFELYSRVNVSVLFQTPGAQIAATVIDADTKSVAELDDELTRLRDRARSGELTSPEQAGATFTLTDLGGFGVHRAGALVTPPQAAALTAGAVRAVPVIRDGAVTPGAMLSLTLACDHRILFGAQAAEFLMRIAMLLQEAQ